MLVVKYTAFRKHLRSNLNKVIDDAEIMVVSRRKRKNVVVMSLEEYNTIQETMHVIKFATNQKRLDSAIEEMKKGKFSNYRLQNY